MDPKIDWPVLFWIPNIIGYLRILFCMLSVWAHDEGYSSICIILFTLNFFLDGIDGFLARKLQQTSNFGAWFDVYVDLISRGFLWIIVNGIIGYAVISWEWLAFFAIHVGYGQKWKTAPKAPAFVSFVMKNNFKTVFGFYVIGSLFLLPTWWYMMQHLGHMLSDLMTYSTQFYVLLMLIFGRFIAAAVEFWYISIFIKSLLMSSDAQSKNN